MSNYSKLVGQTIYGLLGLAAGFGIQWATDVPPGYVEAISTLIGGAIGTYAAKPNKPAV